MSVKGKCSLEPLVRGEFPAILAWVATKEVSGRRLKEELTGRRLKKEFSVRRCKELGAVGMCKEVAVRGWLIKTTVARRRCSVFEIIIWGRCGKVAVRGRLVKTTVLGRRCVVRRGRVTAESIVRRWRIIRRRRIVRRRRVATESAIMPVSERYIYGTITTKHGKRAKYS